MQTASAANSRPMPLLAWLMVGLSAVIAAVWFFHARGYWEDDAWIHLEFARSVAAGKGFAFDGTVVYGDTSPLWVWLLVAVHVVIRDWLAASKTLCVAGALFAMSGFFVLGRSLLARRVGAERATLFAAAMVLLLAVNPFFGYWAFSGMEALTAAGLACFGLWLAGSEPMTPGVLILAALVGGMAPLLRPEMGFYTVLLGLWLAWRLWTMAGSNGLKLVVFAAGCVCLLAPFALWAHYAVHTFGSVLPTTNAAKRASAQDSVVRHVLQILAAGFPLVFLSAGGLVAARFMRAGADGRRPAPSAAAWLMLAWSLVNFVFYVADHTYVQTRYLFVTAPVLILVLLAPLAIDAGRLYRALLTLGLVSGCLVSGLATWRAITNKAIIVRDVALLADEVRTLPPGAMVADYSIGEIAFLTQHPILDTGGILRPEVIPYLAGPDERPRLRWAQAQGAQYIVEWDTHTSRGTIVWEHDFPVSGWYLNPRRYGEKQKLVLYKLLTPQRAVD